MTDSGGSKRFGEVLFEWHCCAEPPRCEIRGSWRGSEFLHEPLNREHSEASFSVSAPNDPKSVVCGLLAFRVDLPALTLHRFEYPGGSIDHYRLWPGESPPTPPDCPTDPLDPEVAESVEQGPDDDLFPYIQLRPWPRISSADLEDRFVQYERVCEEQSTVLYCALAKLKSGDDRLAMEQEAVKFIEGESPYNGWFLRSVSLLDGHIALFAAFDEHIRGRSTISLGQFHTELAETVGLRWDAVPAYVDSEPYQTALERVWQNLFALAVVLGYDRDLFEDLIRTVVMGELLARMVNKDRRRQAPSDQYPEGGAEPVPLPLQEAWPSSRILAGASATVILPEAAFPMPAAKPPPAGESSKGLLPLAQPIEPYAIGDLQMVRQRLLRYELGEVSCIENVLRGEWKEKTGRNLTRVRQVVETDETETRSLRQTDLVDESRKVLRGRLGAYYETTYGPAKNAKAGGYWELKGVEKKATGAAADDADDRFAESARFAQDVTSKAAGALARKVVQRRLSETLDESEETVVHRIDATASTENIRGVYRWVNKVYSAHVSSYGRRLILQFFVPRPARSYINGQLSLKGLALAEPTAPEELGLRSFEDVSPDPTAGELFYGKLAARYHVKDVSPPPPETLVTSAILRGGLEATTQDVALPEGYGAHQAAVCLSLLRKSGYQVLGVVGRTPFSFPLNGEASPSLLDASSAAVVEPQLLPMNGETSIVPVGVMAALTESSPSSLDEDPILPDRLNYVLTVEVVSKRSSRTLEDWRVRTYDAVVRGYRELSAQYHRAAGESPSERAAHNPLANLETVRGELKRDILRQLLDQACRLTGEADQTLVNQPRYAQFFEDALEWREMAYSFAVSVGDSPDQQTLNDYRGELEPFTAFLQASWARVHLPVVPGRSFAVPYFLASGMTWDGRNDLTPCNRGSVDLINDLKSEVAECPAASKPWEVRIPTSMTLLQGSPDLPVFKR